MPEQEMSDAGLRFRRLVDAPMRQVGVVGPFTASNTWRSIREILDHREMLDLLVKRDLKSRYKDSVLGFVWVLVRPIILLAVYFVVLGHFLGAARGIPDFGIFIFTGLTAMGLFQEIVVGGTGSILANAGLVKKVYMPRELFPLASVGSALFNFLMQLIVLVVATLLVAKPPIHLDILYVIPSLAVIVVYGLALALLLGAANVYLRDVQYLVEVGTMLLFWASPVVYSWQMVATIINNPVVLQLYTDNPLTLAILGFQRAFWVSGADLPQPPDLLLRLIIALLVGLVGLLLCHRAFLQMQGNFAQEL